MRKSVLPLYMCKFEKKKCFHELLHKLSFMTCSFKLIFINKNYHVISDIYRISRKFTSELDYPFLALCLRTRSGLAGMAKPGLARPGLVWPGQATPGQACLCLPWPGQA